jgi:Domain of unknown function (DUF4419)
MNDYIQSLLDKFRQRDSSLRLTKTFKNESDILQDLPLRKRSAEVAKILPTRSGSTGITFAVDAVEPKETALPTTTLVENLEMRGGTSVLILPEQSSRVVAPGGYLVKESDLYPYVDQHRFLNPLVEAVQLAFSGHRSLVLNPDSIWLTIVQGFGRHINLNAEALRTRIVRHEGQKELCVEIPSLAPEVWPRLISKFSALIRDHSDPVLYETLLCDFSTTTPNVRLAIEVALMNAYQRYFKYVGHFVCGIPTITLQGDPDDWQRIRDRIEVLATFGLEWWTSRLAPILDEFVATANGEPNLEFWKAIYKPQRTYAAQLASGWIVDLFPYVGESNIRRNPLLEMKRTDWLVPKSEDKRFGTGIRPDSFPCGLSKASLELRLPKKSQMELNLVGGFVGVSQSEEDLSLAPVISWAVAEMDERTKPAAS